MYSIGEMSRRTKVKIPTIRYYESIGLMTVAERTEGNQRRYGNSALQQLFFIRHARDLGFSVEAILSLTMLQGNPDCSCEMATEIALTHLADVRLKIERLKALEKELSRIAQSCDGSQVVENCHILESLADHGLCSHDH